MGMSPGEDMVGVVEWAPYGSVISWNVKHGYYDSDRKGGATLGGRATRKDKWQHLG